MWQRRHLNSKLKRHFYKENFAQCYTHTSFKAIYMVVSCIIYTSNSVQIQGKPFHHTSAEYSHTVYIAGKGANVILDCIGGSCWERNVKCLATDGRWVLYGTLGGRTVEGDLLGKLLSKRGQLLSSLLRSRSLQVRIQYTRT